MVSSSGFGLPMHARLLCLFVTHVSIHKSLCPLALVRAISALDDICALLLHQHSWLLRCAGLLYLVVQSAASVAETDNYEDSLLQRDAVVGLSLIHISEPTRPY